jgi:hypothetical protein
MNTVFVTVIGVIFCTGPLWGGLAGYALARRGYRLRSPLHQSDEE